MKRKRRPGAGRKPRGPFKGNTAKLTMRVDPGIRRALEAGAKEHRHSLSQEAQFHIQRSMLRDRNSREDIIALTEAITIAIRYVEHITKKEWRDSESAPRRWLLPIQW